MSRKPEGNEGVNLVGILGKSFWKQGKNECKDCEEVVCLKCLRNQGWGRVWVQVGEGVEIDGNKVRDVMSFFYKRTAHYPKIMSFILF